MDQVHVFTHLFTGSNSVYCACAQDPALESSPSPSPPLILPGLPR